MNIDKMCNDAKSRMVSRINRSAGQHIRALKSRTPSMPMLDLLYCIGCESETGDKHMGMLLALAGISRADLDAHMMPDKSATQRELMADPFNEGVPA